MSIRQASYFIIVLGIALNSVAWAAEAGDMAAAPPKVGEKVKSFKLLGLDDKPVELQKLLKKGPVALVVLRGYPGYQCPVCTKQAASFMEHADEFDKLDATVVFVYPGPAKQLDQRAKEFLKDITLPKPMVLVLDPDYKFVSAHGLRWSAPGETAYPSTFVLDGRGNVKFRKVSKSHGDRAGAAEVLKALQAAKS